MKTNLSKFVLGIGLISAPMIGFAQKQNVTDAAMLMKKYNPMAGAEAAKKTVEDAKKFIDLAAEHPETKEDLKMHLYRGEIYYAAVEVMSFDMMAGKEVDKSLAEKYTAISKESFKKVMDDPKKKFSPDAEVFINFRTEMAFNMGIKAYNDKNFEQASGMFLAAYVTNSFLGKEYKEALSNTTLSLNNAVDDFIAKKEYDKATKLAEGVYNQLPKNIDVLITLVNINLQKGDAQASEKYINEALAIDPKNKQLYYILGTSYIDAKKNEKAEEVLNKALEIDPNYTEAQYQLGAHLFNWANDLKFQAGQLDFKDPKGPKLEAEANVILGRAITVLEKYIEKNPNDKAVLDILYKTYYKLENYEKADEYKKRAAAIKQ